MLINNSLTIAIEIPVFLYQNEITKYQRKAIGIELADTMTGHIDILLTGAV